MIEYFTLKTAKDSQFWEQANLRKKEFIDRQGWQGPSVFEDMEFDAFDTPQAHYLLYRDDQGKARGTLRMLPTETPYMVEVLWPDFVDGNCPKSPDIWEITRIMWDQGLSKEEGKRAHFELMTAYHEVLHHHGAHVALMFGEYEVAKHGFTSRTIKYHRLGKIDGLPEDPEQRYVAFVTDPVTKKAVQAWRQGPPFVDFDKSLSGHVDFERSLETVQAEI
jgi:N-acyl-L-homoserine lactone synthetase